MEAKRDRRTVAAAGEAAAAARTDPARSIARRSHALLKRGEELISQGDIAAARLMLTRAAEAGDARSALALGATYDPAVLGKLGVLGVAADVAQARAWYGKAAEFRLNARRRGGWSTWLSRGAADVPRPAPVAPGQIPARAGNGFGHAVDA